MGDSAGTRRRSTVLVSPAVEGLAQVEQWPPETVAVGVLMDGKVVGTHGSRDRVFRWASVTKLVTALAALIAAEEGVVDLDEPAGPSGSTVRHLLAHASGLPFDPAPPIAGPGPGTRRGRSGTSAAAAASCGSTRSRALRSPALAISTSRHGRSKRGPSCRTPCWPAFEERQDRLELPRKPRGGKAMKSLAAV